MSVVISRRGCQEKASGLSYVSLVSARKILLRQKMVRLNLMISWEKTGREGHCICERGWGIHRKRSARLLAKHAQDPGLEVETRQGSNTWVLPNRLIRGRIKETLLDGMRGFPGHFFGPEVCVDCVPCQTTWMTWKHPAEPCRGVSFQELESTAARPSSIHS